MNPLCRHSRQRDGVRLEWGCGAATSLRSLDLSLKHGDLPLHILLNLVRPRSGVRLHVVGHVGDHLRARGLQLRVRLRDTAVEVHGNLCEEQRWDNKLSSTLTEYRSILGDKMNLAVRLG